MFTEKDRARHKRWRDANKEHVRAEAKRWRAKLKDYYLAYNRTYYAANKEALKIRRHLGISIKEARLLCATAPNTPATTTTRTKPTT